MERAIVGAGLLALASCRWADAQEIDASARLERGREYVVDQVEGGVALLIDDRGGRVRIPRRELPLRAREGDVLVDGAVSPAARARRAREAAELRARLARNDPGGDLRLSEPSP